MLAQAVSSGSAIAQEASSTLQEAAYTPVQPEKAPSFGGERPSHLLVHGRWTCYVVTLVPHDAFVVRC